MSWKMKDFLNEGLGTRHHPQNTGVGAAGRASPKLSWGVLNTVNYRLKHRTGTIDCNPNLAGAPWSDSAKLWVVLCQGG